ncbi:hypothetical protein C8R47DRAFT_1083938 [Mycena vitilis]|nr:hypothetical protein C8R47DRAFT_1083938 [Mycena vitilis]
MCGHLHGLSPNTPPSAPFIRNAPPSARLIPNTPPSAPFIRNGPPPARLIHPRVADPHPLHHARIAPNATANAIPPRSRGSPAPLPWTPRAAARSQRAPAPARRAAPLDLVARAPLAPPARLDESAASADDAGGPFLAPPPPPSLFDVRQEEHESRPPPASTRAPGLTTPVPHSPLEERHRSTCRRSAARAHGPPLRERRWRRRRRRSTPRTPRRACRRAAGGGKSESPGVEEEREAWERALSLLPDAHDIRGASHHYRRAPADVRGRPRRPLAATTVALLPLSRNPRLLSLPLCSTPPTATRRLVPHHHLYHRHHRPVVARHGPRPPAPVSIRSAHDAADPPTGASCVYVRLFSGSHAPPDRPSRGLRAYDTQIGALLRQKNFSLYKRDGPGRLYCVVRAQDDDIADFRARRIQADEFRGRVALNVKIGHTSRIERRREEYEVCDDGQTHIWAWTYRVPRRMLAERLVHLEIFKRGGIKDVHECPGCYVWHREFVSFSSIRSLADMDCICKDVFEALGWGRLRRVFFKDNDMKDILKIL